ncbi:transposase [Pseudodesulfovibrio sp.]|uniref:transposase n=1 Tax=unclassified Pseudodesulfovibrio TaxID=2661612 RepID=UPI003AFF7C01
MSRIARIVVPGEPHHIIQRGNRRLPTFFKDDDYIHYLKSMRFWCDKHEVEIWAYCLMTNHVHLIGSSGQSRSGSKKLDHSLRWT